MNNRQKQYYFEMAKRGRMITLYVNDKSEGLLTYFIGNGNINKYVRDAMWSVVDDEPQTGNTCYIDHLLTSKKELNPYVALQVWHNVKRYIKDTFKNVKYVRWNRFKNEWQKPKTFKEGLR